MCFFFSLEAIRMNENSKYKENHRNINVIKKKKDFFVSKYIYIKCICMRNADRKNNRVINFVFFPLSHIKSIVKPAKLNILATTHT